MPILETAGITAIILIGFSTAAALISCWGKTSCDVAGTTGEILFLLIIAALFWFLGLPIFKLALQIRQTRR